MSEMSIRLCYGDSWVYCDGDCVRCVRNKITYSDTTTTDAANDPGFAKSNTADQ